MSEGNRFVGMSISQIIERDSSCVVQRNRDLAEAILFLTARATFRPMEQRDFWAFAGAPKGTLIWYNPEADGSSVEVYCVLVSPPGEEYAGRISVMGEADTVNGTWQVDLEVTTGRVERMI